MVSAENPQEIKTMFARIAHRYDFLNHFLSCFVDYHWRSFVAKEIEKAISKKPILALDLCSGTADLALTLSGIGKIIACDFCHPMLVAGSKKIMKKDKAASIFLAEADALCLPFADDSFDVITIAFGLRNLASLHAGLNEMRRVLKLGGTLAVLEFSKPVLPLFSTLFNLYFTRVLPQIGRLLSGQQDAYKYLPTSVSKFPDQENLKDQMERAGFRNVRFKNLTGGIAALHLGIK